MIRAVEAFAPYRGRVGRVRVQIDNPVTDDGRNRTGLHIAEVLPSEARALARKLITAAEECERRQANVE